VAGTVINLDQFETSELLEFATRSDGTYKAQMMIRGNSILSSVFVKSVSPGATLKVNYFDTTSGTEQLSERFDLNGHALITDADVGKTFRIVVSRIHNKPIIEAVVTGGTIEFGVYVTVVSDFPSELILDENTALPVQEKIPSTSGDIYPLSVDNLSWTLVPLVADRRAISVINESGQEIKLNYADNVDYVGIPIRDGSERRYEHRIPFYLRSEQSAIIILIENII
jgi:hypothetical protein